MKKLSFTAIVSLLLVTSCGHHMDVRPGVGGIHRVRVQGDTKELVSRSAIEQANHFCKERNQYAAIISEASEYVGTMSEDAYNITRTASNVTSAAGVGTGVYAAATGKSYKSKTTKVAAIAAAGGIVGRAIASDGYVYNMTFKCE